MTNIDEKTLEALSMCFSKATDGCGFALNLIGDNTATNNAVEAGKSIDLNSFLLGSVVKLNDCEYALRIRVIELP
jgi:hypothetical protein